MPFRWVPPAVFVEYSGKKVYYSYKGGFESDPYTYHYTTDEVEEPHYEFDVRELQRGYTLYPGLDMDDIDNRRKVIVAAIDKEVLEFPEEEE